MNTVNLYGNIGQDPELKESEFGPVCVLNVATHEHFKKDGEAQERTDWHRVVVFGPTATACGKYLTKGSPVIVEGKLKTRSFMQDDQKRFITEVVAKRVQFVGSSAGSKEEFPQLEAEEASWDIPF